MKLLKAVIIATLIAFVGTVLGTGLVMLVGSLIAKTSLDAVMILFGEILFVSVVTVLIYDKV